MCILGLLFNVWKATSTIQRKRLAKRTIDQEYTQGLMRWRTHTLCQAYTFYRTNAQIYRISRDIS